MDSNDTIKLTHETIDMMHKSGLLTSTSNINVTNINTDFIVKTIINFFNILEVDVDSILNQAPEESEVLGPEITKVTNLYAALASNFELLHIKDFTLWDILNPGKKKTNMFLKYLGNFLLYYKNMEKNINDQLEEIYSKHDSKDKIQQDICNLRAESSTFARQRADLEKKNEMMKREIEETKRRNEKKEPRKLELQKKLQELKEEHSKNIKILSTKQSQLEELHLEIAETRKLLVKSPVKIDEQISKLEALKKEKAGKIANHSERINNSKTNIDFMENACKSMEQILAKSEAFANSIEHSKCAKEKLEKMVEERGKIGAEIEVLKKEISEINRRTVSQQEALADLKLKQEKQIEELRSQHFKLKNTISNSGRDKCRAEKAETEMKIQELRQEILNIERENEEFLSQSEEAYLKQLQLAFKQQEDLEAILDSE